MSKRPPKPFTPRRKPDPARSRKIRARMKRNTNHATELEERMRVNRAWLEAQKPLGEREARG